MVTSFLRLPSVCLLRALSRSSIYKQIKGGLFPPPVSIGARAVGWPANEVDAVNRARMAGKSEHEIRELVKALVVARKKLA